MSDNIDREQFKRTGTLVSANLFFSKDKDFFHAGSQWVVAAEEHKVEFNAKTYFVRNLHVFNLFG